MGRPRKWASDADRKRAQRGDETEPVDIAVINEGPSVLQPFPKNRPAPDLEIYVAEAREAARITAEAMALRRTGNPERSELDKVDIEDRVKKAESYARWRWQGYRDGEIVSL